MFNIFRKKRVYLDHASATPELPEAALTVAKMTSRFGNPGGVHVEAVAAKKILDDSRAVIAAQLECKAREIVFTSGLTEANNLAILGFARKLSMDGNPPAGGFGHWIVSSIEHSSVLECFAEVERLGGRVTHIDPDEKGIIAAESVARALRPETVFVSIGWANNEIGVIQPLSAIAEAIHAHEKRHGTTVLLHSDAGQGPLYKYPHVHTLDVDLFSLGSGKLYGPRGIGALYLSNRAQLAPVLLGGGQERGLRSGTEEPTLAAGFAKAFEIISRERESEARRLQKMRDDLARELVAQIPDVVINGDLKHSLPHMLNISIPNINSEYLVLSLDRAGFALSTKSACNEGESASHVVAALGGPDWRAQNTIRISLGRSTFAKDLNKFIENLVQSITYSR